MQMNLHMRYLHVSKITLVIEQILLTGKNSVLLNIGEVIYCFTQLH